MPNQSTFGAGRIDAPNPQKNAQLVYDPQVIYGTIGTAGSVSNPIDLCGWTNFAIQSVPNGTITGGTVFAIWGATSLAGPYYPLYGTTGTVATTVQIGSTTNGIYGPIAVLEPIRFIELVAPGTQASAQTFALIVK